MRIELVRAYLLLAMSSLSFSVMSVFVRMLGRDRSYEAVCIRFVFGIVVILALWQRGWMLILAIGLFATAGQLVMTYAFKFVPDTQGSILSFCTPVLNVIAGACLFHEAMPVRSWMGSGLVIGACVYVSLAKHPPASVGVQRM